MTSDYVFWRNLSQFIQYTPQGRTVPEKIWRVGGRRPPRQRGGRTLRWRGIKRPLVTSRWYANTHKIQAHDLAREIIHYFRQVHENKDGLRKTPNIQSNIRFAQYRKIRTDGTLKLRVPKRQSLGGYTVLVKIIITFWWFYSKRFDRSYFFCHNQSQYVRAVL